MTDDTTSDDPGLDTDEYVMDPDAEELPDLSGNLAPLPPQHVQDDVPEGMGARQAKPRPWPKAVKVLLSYIRKRRSVTVGYCLKYTRGYYRVGPKYGWAEQSGRSAKPRHRLKRGGWAPRGSIVYWAGGGHQYGHIAPSLGGGFCGSTDWPRGRVGRVNIWTLADAWGYPEVWWSPQVNDVTVWRRGLIIDISRVNRMVRLQRGRAFLPKGRKMLRRINRALKSAGYKVNKKQMTRYHRGKVRAFQRQQGWTGSDADGLLGPVTLKRLGIHSFRR